MWRFVVGLAAALFAVMWAGLDSFWFHNHWSDGHLLKYDILPTIEGKGYLEGNETVAPATAIRRHWVTLEGKVDSPEFKRDLGQSMARIHGVRGVTNNIQVLNTPALAELQKLLADDPYNTPMNYVVRRNGTVHLTGPMPPDPELKDRIGKMVGAIAGVQKVENRLGEQELALVEIENRIRDILRFNNIYFDFNKWSIRDDSRIALDLITQVLKDHPTIAVRIEGHTDSIASDKYNIWLSNKRTEAVEAALVERGIDTARMEAKGYGESQPVAPNTTPEGRAENRRIEFKVTGELPVR